eukprot:4532098-Pleurochrysis_carterae.AAC.9
MFRHFSSSQLCRPERRGGQVRGVLGLVRFAPREERARARDAAAGLDARRGVRDRPCEAALTDRGRQLSPLLSLVLPLLLALPRLER